MDEEGRHLTCMSSSLRWGMSGGSAYSRPSGGTAESTRQLSSKATPREASTREGGSLESTAAGRLRQCGASRRSRPGRWLSSSIKPMNTSCCVTLGVSQAIFRVRTPSRRVEAQRMKRGSATCKAGGSPFQNRASPSHAPAHGFAKSTSSDCMMHVPTAMGKIPRLPGRHREI